MAVSVSVNPTTATVLPAATRQITATVTGFISDNTVTWSIFSGAGTVSSSGLFTATENGAGTTVVRATSNEDNTKHADCTVTVPVTLAVAPSPVTVEPGDTQQFTATVHGSVNHAVTWSIGSGSGSVSNAGLYTAGLAGTDTVHVVSSADNTVTADVTVTVPTLAAGAAGVHHVHLPDAHNHWLQNVAVEYMKRLDPSSSEFALGKAALASLAKFGNQ